MLANMVQNLGIRMFCGLLHSFQGFLVICNYLRDLWYRFLEGWADRNAGRTKSRDLTPTELTSKNLMKTVFKCCCLNGVLYVFSVCAFNNIFLRIFDFTHRKLAGDNEYRNEAWVYQQTLLENIFNIFWILPIFLLNKAVSSLWFTDIADSAYKISLSRKKSFSSIGMQIADFFLNIVYQIVFYGQAVLCLYIPYVGKILCFIQLCYLYSLYSFEYKWTYMGWSLHKRLSYIEMNWDYFIGFGIPMGIITQCTDSYIMSGCLFSLTFSIFLLSADSVAPPSENAPPTTLPLFRPTVFVLESLLSIFRKFS